MRDRLLFFLFFVVGLQLSVSAQQKAMEDSDWQIFLDDSIILSGNLNTRYKSRPVAYIDIDDGKVVKDLTIIFKNYSAKVPLIEFKEGDSTIYRVYGYYSEQTIGDTIVIRAKYHSEGIEKLKGKRIGVYYSNDQLQTTPTLLGTLIVKKD